MAYMWPVSSCPVTTPLITFDAIAVGVSKLPTPSLASTLAFTPGGGVAQWEEATPTVCRGAGLLALHAWHGGARLPMLRTEVEGGTVCEVYAVEESGCMCCMHYMRWNWASHAGCVAREGASRELPMQHAWPGAEWNYMHGSGGWAALMVKWRGCPCCQRPTQCVVPSLWLLGHHEVEWLWVSLVNILPGNSGFLHWHLSYSFWSISMPCYFSQNLASLWSWYFYSFKKTCGLFSNKSNLQNEHLPQPWTLPTALKSCRSRTGIKYLFIPITAFKCLTKNWKSWGFPLLLLNAR